MTTYLRTDMIRVELVAADQRLLFDAIESENESVTIRRIRNSDDGQDVAKLIGLRHTEARIISQPLASRAQPVGAPLIYAGEMTVSTKMESESSEIAWLTVRIPRASVSVGEARR